MIKTVLLGVATALALCSAASAQAVVQSRATGSQGDAVVMVPSTGSGYPGSSSSQAKAVIVVDSTGAVVPSSGLTPVTSVGSSSLLAKASAGNLYGYDLTEGAGAGFFAFLNAASVPAGAASITPVACIAAAAGSSQRFRQTLPDRYTVGIVVVSTSSCTTYTAVTPVMMAAVVQ